MLFWLKKLVKPRWIVSYDCEECMNNYCGGCGRGVAECDYFYTKRAAMKAAEIWARGDNHEPGYEIIVTEIDGHTTVVLHYKINGQEGDCSIFASVDLRRYW